jgi:hypothetical protein
MLAFGYKYIRCFVPGEVQAPLFPLHPVLFRVHKFLMQELKKSA